MEYQVPLLKYDDGNENGNINRSIANNSKKMKKSQMTN